MEEWIKKHYGQLVGYKITDIARDDNPDGGDPFVGLVLAHKNGHKEKIAWILMDPEGNGAGHLDIQEG